MKLRKKIGTTVQILSHIKEKLSYVSDQREHAAQHLNEKEQEVKQVNFQLDFITLQFKYTLSRASIKYLNGKYNLFRLSTFTS